MSHLVNGLLPGDVVLLLLRGIHVLPPHRPLLLLDLFQLLVQ
jgi:hypothetical protein